MKNLKKVLSLALALVMVIGVLATSGFAALDQYTDGDEVTYVEAIDVMSAIGVINGFSDGSIRALDGLTRAQGAKIIAYLLLGQTAADALGTVPTKFADVTSNHWASGAINYCVQQGIIDGYSATQFGPEDPLTGLQFAKMLLGALGYGVNDEFTGGTWAVEVAKLALSEGLFKKNEQDANNNAVTRESAMQTAFNALNVSTVSWSELFGEYVSSNIFTGTTAKTLAELIGLTEVKNLNDAYGYAAHSWKMNNKIIAGPYAVESAVKTINSTVDVTLGDLYGYGSWVSHAASTATSPNFEVYVNGEYEADMSEDFEDILSRITRNNKTKLSTAGLLGADVNYTGLEINFVENSDGDIYKVVIVVGYLAEVTRVTSATSSAARQITIKVYDNAATTYTTTIDTDDFAKGDFLIVVPSSNGTAGFDDPIEMTLAEVVTGTLTTISNNNFVVNGSTYGYSTFAQSGAIVAMGSLNFDDTYNFYLDNYGFVVGSDVETAVSSSSSYLYVHQLQAQSKNDLFTDNNAVKVKVTYIDGKTAIVDYNVKTSNSSTTGYSLAGTTASPALSALGTLGSGKSYITVTTAGGDVNVTVEALADDTAFASFEAIVGSFSGEWAFKTTSSGAITLSNVTEPATGAKAYGTSDLTATFATTKSNPKVAGISSTATSSTVMVVASGSNISTYTGYANFPNYTLASGANVLYTIQSGRIVNILVVGDTVAVAADSYAVYNKFMSSQINGGKTLSLGVDGGAVLNTYSFTDDDSLAVYDAGLSKGDIVGYNNGVLVDVSSSVKKVTNVDHANEYYIQETDGTSTSYLVTDDTIIYDATGANVVLADVSYFADGMDASFIWDADTNELIFVVITG